MAPIARTATIFRRTEEAAGRAVRAGAGQSSIQRERRSWTARSTTTPRRAAMAARAGTAAMRPGARLRAETPGQGATVAWRRVGRFTAAGLLRCVIARFRTT